MSFPRLTILALLTCLNFHSAAQVGRSFASPVQTQSTRDLEIAARFAPVFYQALGDKPRNDYITNFDFDGDWKGDNNWANSDDKERALKAFIYYSLAETESHYFIHYAIFHPRDYKGGELRGAILSELIREGAKRGGSKYDPTGLVDEATLAHENDLEGALVVVRKSSAKVEFVETLAHNNFLKYKLASEGDSSIPVRLDDQHPVLYIEPKGHGIESFTGDSRQTDRKDFLKYVVGEKAESPNSDLVCRTPESSDCSKSVRYELASLEVLWRRAKAEINETYGTVCDYGTINISLLVKGKATDRKIKLGKRGCAFVGTVGGINMARPPWGWFDKKDRSQVGMWFFNPAVAIKDDFRLTQFSTTYIRPPLWAQD